MRTGNGLASLAGSLTHPSMVLSGLAAVLAEEPIVKGDISRQAEGKPEIRV